MENPDKITHIVLDNGNLFDGNIEQFADSFFSNATIENILDWAEENGYKAVITLADGRQFMILP